jgi:hypothetical protein
MENMQRRNLKNEELLDIVVWRKKKFRFRTIVFTENFL